MERNYTRMAAVFRLLLLCVMTVAASGLELPIEVSKVTERVLGSYLSDQVDTFKADLHRSYESHRHRQRRSAAESSVAHWVLNDIIPANGFHTKYTSAVTHFTYKDDEYVMVGAGLSDDGSSCQASSTAFVYQNSTQSFVDSDLDLVTSCVSDIEAFFIDGTVYLAIAQKKNDAGRFDVDSVIYKFDADGPETFPIVQRLGTNGATDFEYFNHDGTSLLAITNEQTDRYAGYRTKFEVFQWVGTYFDRIAKATTFAAQDACGFAINGQVYFAVAQYQDNGGSYDVGSIIFQYDEVNVELREFQTIPSTAAMDFEYFEVNGNHYLALANYMERKNNVLRTDTNSVIFWWAGNQFVEYQRIATHGATKIESISLPNGEVLLAIGNSDNDVGVVILSLDNTGQFVPTSTNAQGFNPWADMSTHTYPVIDDLLAFNVGSTTYLAVANNGLNHTDTGDAVFEVELAIEVAVPEPLDPILDCFHSVIKNLTSQMAAVEKLQERLDNRMSLTQVQSVDSPVVFQANVTTSAAFQTGGLELQVDNRFDLNPDLPVVSKYDIQANLTSMENNINSMVNESRDVVMLSSEQNIDGNIVLEDPVIIVLLNVTNLKTSDGLINSVDIVNVNNTALSAFDLDTIDGSITFHGGLLANSDITVTNNINGLSVPVNILQTNGGQIITGNKTFQDVDFAANVATTTVNDITISSDLVTQTTDQIITANKILDNDVAVFGDMNLAPGVRIDSVDPSHFASTVVSRSNPGNINGIKRFEDNMIINADLTVTADINGVNVQTLASEVVLTSDSPTITGDKEFMSNVDVTTNITVGGLVNGIDLSADVVTLTTPQNINGFITISGDVTVNGNVISDSVNDLDLSTEAVLTYGLQNITGLKIFEQGFSVGGNIDVYEGVTVDGVDLDVFDSNAMKLTQEQTVFGDKTFNNNVTVEGGVDVNGTVDGLDLNAIAGDVLTISTDQTISVPLMLYGNFTVSGNMAITNTIDGKLESDFIKLDTADEIQGFKTFSEDVEIEGNLDMGPGLTIDTVDVSALDAGALKKVGDQTIHNDITFSSLTASSISVTGYINDMNITEDLVLLHSQQDITGHKTFGSPLTAEKDLSAINITVSGLVNGVDIASLPNNAVLNDTTVTIGGDKTFTQDFTVQDNLVVDGTVDGVVTSDFDNVVTLDGTQDIPGEKTFDEDVTFNAAVIVDGLVNTQNLYEFSQTVILLHTSDVIRGAKTFTGSRVNITKDLIVDMINGLDLSEFNTEYLSKTLVQTLNGVKTFTQTMTLGNLLIEAGNTIDGKDLATLVLLNTDQIFTVDVVFTNTLHVNGDISVTNGINGINPVQLNSSIVRLHSVTPQLVSGTKRFQRVTIENNAQIMGILNSLNFSALPAELVSNLMSPVTIYADTIFTSDVYVDYDVNFTSTVNGVDVDFLYKDVVTTYEPQTITGAKTFHNVTFVTMIEIDKDLYATFHTQGVELSDFVESIVLKSANQVIYGDITFTGDLKFKQNLDVDGTIDNCNISLNAVLKGANQVLTGLNTFNSDVTVLGNLQVDVLIDGVNISAIQEGAVSLSQTQDITGFLTFVNDVIVTGNIDVLGLVNDIDIDADLVTLNTPQNITGNKTFLASVSIGGNLHSDLINGYSLIWHSQYMVTHNGNHVISGHKIFHNVTLQDSLILNGLINDAIDPSEMKDYSGKVFTRLTQDIVVANLTVRDQCEAVYNLTNSMEGQGIMFSHFEDWQDIYTLGALQFHSADYEYGTLLILTENSAASLSRCATGHVYMCPDDGSSCYKIVESGLPAATSINGYSLSNKTVLVITYSQQSSACGYSGAEDLTEIRWFDSSASQNLTTNKAKDTVMFSIDDDVYLAVANGNDNTDNANIDSQVYLYDKGTDTFAVHQVINTRGAKSVAFVDGDDKFLVFAESYDSAGSTSQVTVEVYKWDSGTSQFSITGDGILDSGSPKTYTASDVVSFSIDSVPHVAYSSQEVVASEGGDIKIYSYKSSSWQLEQRIILLNVIDLEVVEAGGNLCLLASDSSHNLHVYQWAKASQFQFYLSIKISGLQSVHSFKHLDDLYVAAAAHVESSDSSETVSKIMKIVVKGDRSPLEFLE
ncbi:uncharacterized protein [Ptychodera flava]|uniref:uncharacterized protein n=1 Tax=Ptychodera flava TaxID=63121 RepID=UPI00396A3AD6